MAIRVTRLTVQIIGAEREIDQTVYGLFHLTSAGIALIDSAAVAPTIPNDA